MKILLGDFHAQLGREDIFKPTIRTESLHQVGNDNAVRILNFATSRILVVKSTCSCTETFISTPGPLLMARFTNGLITY